MVGVRCYLCVSSRLVTVNLVPMSGSPIGVVAQASNWSLPAALRLSRCTSSTMLGAMGGSQIRMALPVEPLQSSSLPELLHSG
jgi:hypothetical protein